MLLERSAGRWTRATRLLRAALPGLLLISAHSSARAQKLWDAGGGANTSWFTATNWAGDTLPVAADDVVNNLNAAMLFNGGSSTVNSLASAGVFTLQSGTLSANAPGVSTFQVNNTFNLSGGTLSGFVVNAGSGGQGVAGVSGTAIFSGVTLNAGLSLTNASLRFQGGSFNSAAVALTSSNLSLESSQTLNNTTLNFVGASASSLLLENNNTSVVLGATTTLQGRMGSLGNAIFVGGSARTLTNNGTILSNVAGQTTTVNPTAFTNGATGVVTATNGATVTFGASTLTNQGLLQANNSGGTGGTLNLASDTLANAGGTILAGSGGTVSLNSTTINGGSLASTGSGILSNAGTSTLNGVAVSGTMDMAASSSLRLQGSTSLTGVNLTAAGGSNVSIESSNVALTSGSIIYGGAAAGSLLIEGTGTGAVIGPGFTVSGRISSIGNAIFVGGFARTLTNNGVLALDTGGQATSITPTAFTNGATGAFRVVNGATATFNTSDSVANLGEILIGAGSSVSLGTGNTLNQAGGSTTVNGTLNATNGTSVNVSAGVFGGSGTVAFTGAGGSLNNTGGTVSAGTFASPGTLAVNGVYTQGAGGTLLVELGGAGAGQFDLLDVSGAANLNGLLSVSLFGGFVPAVGQTFVFLEYGSRVGNFFGEVSSQNAGFTYSVQYSPTAATLRVETVGPVASAAPEPSALALLALPLVSVVIRKRHKA